MTTPTVAQTPAEAPVYAKGEVPEHLRTTTQLKADRLKPAPGQEPSGWLSLYRRGHGWGKFPLYDPAGAAPMRPLSAKQQAAKDARRTCPKCQTLRPYIVYRACTECREQEEEARRELAARTCDKCRRVSGAPLGKDVRNWTACVPCRIHAALRYQFEQERYAVWARTCRGTRTRKCTTVLHTDEEIAAAKAARTWAGPGRCGPCNEAWDQEQEAERLQAIEDEQRARKARLQEVQQLREWAAAALADPDVVVLDTETTGLHDTARIVEIAATTATGDVILNTLINPGEPIGEASDIHGITDHDVADAPTFASILPALTEALAGRRCLIYNAPYDEGRLRHELTAHYEAAGHPDPGTAATAWLGQIRFEDVMTRYSDWVGEWSDYWGNNAWQPLDGGHRALGDCLAAIECLSSMAKNPDQDTDPWAVPTA